jgi:ubiquinone/menaquinone biosynthesis C-methylase UbiE
MPATDEPDHEALRAENRERWDRSAPGWAATHARLTATTMPVSRWLVDAIQPQPGQRVLELAAGVGETGFLAAELIQPGGTLICSDGSEAMLAQARARAAELGLRNVEFALIDLEWIDLPTASVDAVLCRWGYMFALDRDAAARETRRVLRPGGRVALATWTEVARNPWARVPREALYDAGLIDSLELRPPDPFALSTPERIADLLEGAGFADVVTEEIELAFRFADVDDLIADTCARSRPFADVVEPLNARQRDDLWERIGRIAAPYAAPDGGYVLPGIALVAVAEA